MGTTDWLKWIRVMFEGAIYSYCRKQYLVLFERALSFQKGFSLAKQLINVMIHFQKSLHMKRSYNLMFYPHTLHSDFFNHSFYMAFSLNHLRPTQPDEPARNGSFVRLKFIMAGS